VIVTMGWRGLFKNKKSEAVERVMAHVKGVTNQQEAATSRLELTIQRVIDAKTGRKRNVQTGARFDRE
jgi:hypothetical protein